MPRPTLTRDRLLYVLSEEVPMSHREILEKTGLSPSAVWNGLKRCWDDGFVLRTKTAIYETEKVFRGRKGSVSTTRPYHLYLKKPEGLDSVKVDGFDFVSFSREYLDPRARVTLVSLRSFI
jgi:DNA-binding Lrp family transcriptional regulator